MCIFITATLPPDASIEAVRAVFERHGRRLDEVENQNVLEQLPSGERYFCTTSGHCDCGTALGSTFAFAETSPRTDDISQKILKLRRKGWSEAKIQRWVEQDRRNREQDQRARIARESYALESGEIVDWVALIREIMATGQSSSVGLLVHWYSTSPEQEAVDLRERVRLAADSITEEDLLRMRHDTVYEFHASR